jgi:dienelactone hydrolase
MSCPECFSGHIRDDDTPRGTVKKVHGLDSYVSEPADGRTARGIIVIIPDAFGWEFVNNRLLADHFSEKGDYRVYLPNFFKGTSKMASNSPSPRLMSKRRACSAYLDNRHGEEDPQAGLQPGKDVRSVPACNTDRRDS